MFRLGVPVDVVAFALVFVSTWASLGPLLPLALTDILPSNAPTD